MELIEHGVEDYDRRLDPEDTPTKRNSDKTGLNQTVNLVLAPPALRTDSQQAFPRTGSKSIVQPGRSPRVGHDHLFVVSGEVRQLVFDKRPETTMQGQLRQQRVTGLFQTLDQPVPEILLFKD